MKINTYSSNRLFNKQRSLIQNIGYRTHRHLLKLTAYDRAYIFESYMDEQGNIHEEMITRPNPKYLAFKIQQGK